MGVGWGSCVSGALCDHEKCVNVRWAKEVGFTVESETSGILASSSVQALSRCGKLDKIKQNQS